MRKLSERQVQNILRKYQEGATSIELAKRYRVTPGCISHHVLEKLNLRRHIDRGDKRKDRKWTKKSIDRFLLDHGSTIRLISHDVKNCRCKITWKCTLCGNVWDQNFDSLRGRIEGGSKHGCRDCGRDEFTMYHDLLDNIDAAAAYFLGVYAVRGNLKGNTVRINGPEKNLKGLRDLIGSNHPLKVVRGGSYRGKKYTTNSLSFTSKVVADRLRALNNGNRDVMPKGIGQKMGNHFVRGIFDYKGSIFIPHNQNKVGAKVLLTGSEELLESILGFYHKDTGSSRGRINIHSNGNGYCMNEVNFNGVKSCHSFLKWVYNSYVSPIKYQNTEKYDKFLKLQRIISAKEEKREVVKEYAQRYIMASNDFHNNCVERIAADKKMKEIVIRKICMEGYRPTGMRTRDAEVIRKRYKKSLSARFQKKMILDSAMTHVGVTKGYFNNLCKENLNKP